MSSKTHRLSDEIHNYIIDHGVRENIYCQQLREETASLPYAMMQISPEQGQFMQFITKLLGVKRAIEVGTFTGYSSLCVALALPDDGQLIACDINEEWTNIGKKYWKKAEVAKKIDLRLAPAVDTLHHLINDGQSNSFDFAFIDADKLNYPKYYELCLQLLRPGGLLGIDNVLWSGSVADPTVDTEDTNAIRMVNRLVHQDTRVYISMLPIGDGLTLVHKK